MYLSGIQGKNVLTAQQEATNWSKFLFLVDPNTCDFNNVSHMPKVVKYLNCLCNSKVALSGQISKLTTIVTALRMLVESRPVPPTSERNQGSVYHAKVFNNQIHGILMML